MIKYYPNSPNIYHPTDDISAATPDQNPEPLISHIQYYEIEAFKDANNLFYYQLHLTFNSNIWVPNEPAGNNPDPNALPPNQIHNLMPIINLGSQIANGQGTTNYFSIFLGWSREDLEGSDVIINSFEFDSTEIVPPNPTPSANADKHKGGKKLIFTTASNKGGKDRSRFGPVRFAGTRKLSNIFKKFLKKGDHADKMDATFKKRK